MTKDQLWHRLVGASDLAVAQLDCASHPGLLPTSDELKAFGQQTFNLLCTTKGFLSILMRGLVLKEPGPGGGGRRERGLPVSWERGLPFSGIKHVSNVAPLEPSSCRGALYWQLVEAVDVTAHPVAPLYWEIDGRLCVVDPPR